MSDEFYSSDEEFYVRRQSRAPDVRYATRPPPAAFLVPEQRTTVISRNRSHDRSRERSRDGRAGPIIINNNIDHSDFSDSDDGKGYKRRHHRHRSSSAHRPRGRNEGTLMSRADWEAEETRKQLEQLRLAKERDEEEYRLERELREDEELRSTRRKLHEIQKRESRAEMEKRIKEEIEFERLQKEKKEKAEKERREREAKEAVELYKLEETQRKAKAKQKEEDEENAYRSRLEDDLIKAGLDEKYRNKILNNERIGPVLRPGERPVYTRMLKKHLSIETLREFHVEYDLDPDNIECIIVKRHVDEWERKQFWKHTKYIRERRKTIIIEDKHRHRSKPKLEVVVRKEKRSRSKSPGPLLMYLAGAR